MPKIDFSKADETREFNNGKWELVHLGGTTVAKGTLKPGWKWSKDVKPVVGGDSCQIRHVGLGISGTLHVVSADGSEYELHPGETYVIEPGHDAWVVGDTAVEVYEFSTQAAEAYAKPK